jgi:hypothetical protein
MEHEKRTTPSHAPIIDVNVQDTPRESVFGTAELLENILSFLPVKNVFCVQIVSKTWSSVIGSSVTLQQKMFLRPRDRPELWILDKKHKVGANHYGRQYEHLNDTELKFQRIKDPQDDKKTLTPVTLNPMLENDNSFRANVLRMAVGSTYESVKYCGRIDALHDHDASFWRTYLTDPPCHRVDVQLLQLHLHKCVPPTLQMNRDPIGIHAEVAFPGAAGLTIESDEGLRMNNILQACLTARGQARTWFLDLLPWKDNDATIREAADVVKPKLGGGEPIAKSPRMSLRLRLIRVGSAAALLATDEERLAANVDWNPSQ